MSPDPLAISCLRYSAHTFGDRILSWEKSKENGPFGSFAPPLKNPQKMHWTHLIVPMLEDPQTTAMVKMNLWVP
jgi:hypothetical protein